MTCTEFMTVQYINFSTFQGVFIVVCFFDWALLEALLCGMTIDR